ncbi:matrixin family metalloprotease [Parasphingorhabdus cellanae]|uniref:Matrilysin family metalloendoprotease n=1 Tax=Parasphingorhabdus cellanae TaxID=2806553 RepID=A0ABX7T5K5_9SPHN|nr:matrixin family metalloprotease [Parasphingorhabdus cellanae]QTD56860.1 matrilysin family metalloendoprotease [Parasphingorhabdus cellanae]
MTTPPNISQMPLNDMLYSRSMSSEEIQTIQSYLRHYGYLQERFGTLHEGEYDDATGRAVRLFQNCFGLPASGLMDQATLCEMTKPRCGFADILPIGAFTAVSRWEKSELTYKFNSFSTKMAQADIERDVAAAFDLWSEQCDLQFSLSADNIVDIDIQFATGEHGDESPFDGPSGVLAHAYFPPPNGGPLAGDTHFDDDENWTCNVSDTQGIDFLTVAAHEFGHAIGLGHSRQRGALMFPSYSGTQRFLAQDDIAGCQSLYGPPSASENSDCPS